MKIIILEDCFGVVRGENDNVGGKSVSFFFHSKLFSSQNVTVLFKVILSPQIHSAISIVEDIYSQIVTYFLGNISETSTYQKSQWILQAFLLPKFLIISIVSEMALSE